MIEQVGNSLAFYVFMYAAGSSLRGVGVALTVDVYAPDGSLVATGAAVTEIGGGWYRYTLASGSVAVEGVYVATFHDVANARDVPCAWTVGKGGVEHLDADVSSRLAAGSYTAPPSVGVVAAAVWDEAAVDHSVAGSTGKVLQGVEAAGPGGIVHTHTASDANGDPIGGVDVWVTTGSTPGVGVLASGVTDSAGNVSFMLDAGAYYLWEQRAGYTFANPETITVA